MKKQKSLHATRLVVQTSVAAGLTLLLNGGCSRPTAISELSSNAPTQGQSSGSLPASFDNSSENVHFEAVDSNGAFTHHEILLDPMRGQYERGVWQASMKSRSIQMTPGSQTLSVSSATPTKTSNRVNLSFVGDGYTASDLIQYRKDVTSIISQLKTQEPFRTYANYFNFNRVDVVSVDSGVSQDPKGKTRNTALDMSYHCGGIDRLLCGNLNKIVAEAKNAGAVDAIFALANSETYGGAGYSNPPVATFAGRNPGSIELALHEFGHSFGLLADEYSDPGTNNTCLNYSNIALNSAKDIAQKKSKWYRWLGFDGVGAFEGACYRTRGFYRPTDNSKMRALGQPFGAVNTEQFVLQLYKKVRPVDQATREGTYTAHRSFVITPMKPAGHLLKITWSLDNTAVSKLDGVWSLDSKKLNLSAGTHTLVATVVDPTTQVRDEDARRAALTQKLTYKIVISAAVLKL